MEILGILLILVVLGGGAWAIIMVMRARAQGGGSSNYETAGARNNGPPSGGPTRPAPTFTRPRTAEDVLQEGTDPVFEINGQPVEVLGRSRFLELRAFGNDPDAPMVHVSPESGEKLREFKALHLAGPRLLVQQPVGEADDLAYFLYKDESAAKPDGFLAEAKKAWGAFADSDQEGECYLNAFGKRWRLKDIMWFGLHVTEGQMFFPSSPGVDPECTGLLCKCDDEWLFFVVHPATKSSKVWVGRRFDPSAEVTV